MTDCTFNTLFGASIATFFWGYVWMFRQTYYHLNGKLPPELKHMSGAEGEERK